MDLSLKSSPYRGNDEEDLSQLLERIYAERGWDFRNYKRSSLRRRISKRLSALNLSSYKDYFLVLEKDPSEYNKLFSNITIKVSEFFREPDVFRFLTSAVRKYSPGGGGIKAWSCGCARGEEAYSLAILLSECLSAEALKNTKVFATDIDDGALEAGRCGRYVEESIQNVSDEIREKYFFMDQGLHKVRYEIRNLVKFGNLDIVRDSPISGVQVLFCRNLFIYFNKELQEEVFAKLSYSLVPGGILALGKAEVIPSSFASGYEKIGGRMSVYRKRELAG